MYSAAVALHGPTRISFGAVIAVSTNNILNAQNVNVAGSVSMNFSGNTPYGKCIQLAASGASTAVIVCAGMDYLGQRMVENITLNGVTPVFSNKAFRYLMAVTWPAMAGLTLSIGNSAKLGLPYKAMRCAWEQADQVAAAAGTLVQPSLVDPQTAITLDPRGTYTPTTVPNGSRIITAAFDFFNDVNAAGNGGLHGLPHFSG